MAEPKITDIVKKKKHRSPFKEITVVFIIFIIIVVVCLAAYRTSEDTATITVKKTERDNSSSSRYLIFTEEGTTYEIANSYAFMRFDGSDLYGEIEEGETYLCHIAGWRVPFFSMYPNILDAEEKADSLK